MYTIQYKGLDVEHASLASTIETLRNHVVPSKSIRDMTHRDMTYRDMTHTDMTHRDMTHA
jgi:hypothetical protein